jgi:DNA polymerase-3 subunit beta
MHLILDKTKTLNYFNNVQRIAATKSLIPILSGMLLEAKDDQIRLLASDSHLTMQSYFQTQVIQPGRVVIPGKSFTDIMRAMAGDEIIFKTNSDNSIGEITSGKSHFTLNLISAVDFPPFTPIIDGKNFILQAGVLKQLLRLSLYATSNVDARPLYTGLQMIFQPGRITCVATDTFRMVVAKADASMQSEADFAAIVPARALAELSRLLDEDTQQVEISFAQQQVAFKVGETTLLTRTLQGKFPDWESVLPPKTSVEFVMEKEKSLEAIERVFLMTDPPIHRMQVKVDDGIVNFLGNSNELGKSEEEIWVEMGPEKIEFLINAKYMMDFLRSINSAKVRVKICDEMSPLVFLPLEEPGLTCIIVPMNPA